MSISNADSENIVADKILFVDDEAPVLDGYRRMLHREFDVDVAVGGSQGLTSIQEHGPYAIVISDMRMPGMTGSQFLAEVRRKAPDSVRILLTGYSDASAAMEAVNEGQIFRFLTKPCEKDVLVKALNIALEQYRLITSEKEILEKTLLGSIKVLTEVLGAASPEAFGRSMRIVQYVRHVITKLNLPSPWRFEAAASLSQLGCVTLDSGLIQRAYVGTKLSAEDQARFQAHPEVAMNLLSRIPRLEPIAWMIGQQFTKEVPNEAEGVAASSSKEIVLGAKILRLAIAFDDLRMRSMSAEDAIARLRGRYWEFDRELVDVLADIRPESASMERRKVATNQLTIGMVLDQEIRNQQGVLLVAKGQELTPPLLVKLANFAEAGIIAREVVALVPI